MKLLSAILLCSAMLLVSCGDDDCNDSDWIGTYTLDASTADCEDPTVEIDDTIVVTAGSSEGTINIAGTELENTGCDIEFTEPLFGFTFNIELDGDEIHFEGLGCTGTYERQ